MKIALVGANSVENLGDPILYKNTKYLIWKFKENIEIIEVNLSPETENLFIKLLSKILTMFFIISEKLKMKSISFKILKARTKLIYRNHFIKILQNEFDGIVFAGGGLIKYENEFFDLLIAEVIQVANILDIPIYFNSVGVEGYDENNLRCQNLKKHLNFDVVKGITTRDYIDILENKYIFNENIFTDLVGDSALWTDESYEISVTKKNFVGLGVARENIFLDYGFNFNKSEIIDFWVNIVKNLEKMEIPYVFYTNGQLDDNKFLYELMENSFFKSRKAQYFIPNSDQDLIEFTASCDRILATRLHATIIAYSLQVPSCGLIWNEKIASFAEQIGFRNRYFYPNEIDINLIIKELLDAKYDRDSLEIRDTLRTKTIKNLHNFLNSVE